MFIPTFLSGTSRACSYASLSSSLFTPPSPFSLSATSPSSFPWSSFSTGLRSSFSLQISTGKRIWKSPWWKVQRRQVWQNKISQLLIPLTSATSVFLAKNWCTRAFINGNQFLWMIWSDFTKTNPNQNFWNWKFLSPRCLLWSLNRWSLCNCYLKFWCVLPLY